MTHPAAKDPLWTRPFTLTMLGLFFLFIPFALYMPVLPVYLLKEMHGSLEAAGAVNFVFLIGSVLSRAQTARLEAIFGVRRVLLGTAFLFMLTNALYLIPGTTVSVMAIRFISGAMFGLSNNGIYSMGARLVPTSRKGEGLAYLTTTVLAGGSIGPYIGLSLSQAYGFDAVFIFSILISLLGLCIFLFVPMPKEKPPVLGFSIHDLVEVKALPVSLIIFILAFTYGGVVTFVVVFAGELGLPTVGKLFFPVMATMSVASRLVTGKIYDRFGPNAAIYPAIIVLAAGLFLLGAIHTTPALLVAGALVGVGYGISVPSIQALAVQLSPKERISVVTATYFACLDGGFGVGAYLLGGAMHAFGYAAVYLGLGVFASGGLFLYYGVYAGRRNRPPLSVSPEPEEG